jgi:outer membrane protein TolC
MNVKRLLRRLLPAVACLALGFSLAAQERTLSSLDEIAGAARDNSLTYKQAQLAAQSARLAVPDFLGLKSSSLATTYTYGDGSFLDGLSAKLTLPIVDQASVSASVSGSGSGSVSATLSPLAHSDARTQAQIAYQKALEAVSYQYNSVSMSAVQAALSWMGAERELETKASAVANAQAVYEATKQGNAIDPKTITMDDLVTALKNLSAARANLATAQAAERKALGALYADLGVSLDTVAVRRLSLDELQAELEKTATALAPALSAGAAESYSAKVAALTVRADQSAYVSIWPFEPALSVSGGLTFSQSGAVNPVASVTLTLSPDYLKLTTKGVAKTTLALAQSALSQQRSADANAYDQAVAAVKAAQNSVEGYKTSLTQAQEVLDVAAFNLTAGTGSALDAATAKLSLAEAEDSLYKALAEEYADWLNLAALAATSAK